MPRATADSAGDAESVASLTGIEKNLLPYWLSRYPDHPLAKSSRSKAAKLVRSLRREAATRWRSRSSSSRRWPSAGCSRSPPTSPTLTPTSSAAAWSRPPRVPRLVPRTVREHTRLREEQRRVASSRWSPTWTWPALAARRSRPSTPCASARSTQAYRLERSACKNRLCGASSTVLPAGSSASEGSGRSSVCRAGSGTPSPSGRPGARSRPRRVLCWRARAATRRPAPGARGSRR